MSAKLYRPGLSPRIAIVGYGRHGKDTVAEILHGQGPFRCSGGTSWQALPFVAATLNLAPQYAWERRHNNREFWKSYCDWLRRDDPCFLIRLCLEAGNIVPGIRDKIEIDTAIKENLFDAVLWVERPGFPEDPTVTFDKSVATDFIYNDGTLETLREKVLLWAKGKGWL